MRKKMFTQKKSAQRGLNAGLKHSVMDHLAGAYVQHLVRESLAMYILNVCDSPEQLREAIGVLDRLMEADQVSAAREHVAVEDWPPIEQLIPMSGHGAFQNILSITYAPEVLTRMHLLRLAAMARCYRIEHGQWPADIEALTGAMDLPTPMVPTIPEGP